MDLHHKVESDKKTLTKLSDLRKSCRICMGQKMVMTGIFKPYSEKGGINNMIQFCTGIDMEPNDRFPSKICNSCLKNLMIAHQFKTTCILSDETFKKMILNAEVKTEVDDANYDFDSPFTNDYKEEKHDSIIKDEILEAVLSQNTGSSDLSSLGFPPPPPVRRKRGPYKKHKKKQDKNKDTGKDNEKPNLPPKFRRLFCEPCNLKFTEKKLLDDHKKLMHQEINDWICEICGKVFVYRGSHYAHVRSHFPPKFSCAHCEYKTWNKCDLVKHVRIHTGDKRYQCEYCTASYYAKSNLNSHIKRSHERLKRFRCEICAHEFYERSKLNRHMDSHNDIKRYSCEVCHSQFSRRCYWTKHVKIHHGIEIPLPRPGRQKTNFLVGEDLIKEYGKTDEIVLDA